MNVPTTLKKRLVEGKLVLFIGTGLSRESGAPDWRSLLRKLVAIAEEEGLAVAHHASELTRLIEGSTNELLIAAQFLRKELREKMNECIEEQFGTLIPTEAHSIIARLRVGGIITTNFDSLIEDAMTGYQGVGPTVILPDDRAALARLDEKQPWLLKIHGSHKRPDKVVLSASDFENIPDAAIETLAEIFRSHTVLFVGYSLSDPDVLSLLIRIRRQYGGLNRRHYALIDTRAVGAIMADHFATAYGVQSIGYSASSDDHPEVSAFLGRLLTIQREESQDRINKVLLVISANEIHDDGRSERVLLVTDSNPQWKARMDGEAGESGFRGAFLLPSIGILRDDAASVAAAVQGFLGNPDPPPALAMSSDPFISVKHNPATGKETRYNFQFVNVTFRKGSFPIQDSLQLGGRTFTWQSPMSLRGHPPTMALNEDVIVETCKRYGSNLELIPVSLEAPIYRFYDPYSIRSARYSDLPWVRDLELYEMLFSQVAPPIGVVELGCGPAAMAGFVRERVGVPYVGLENSFSMIEAARRHAGSGAEIIRANVAVDQLERRFTGWTFVVKNLLHLLDSPHQFFSTMADRLGEPREVVVVETVSPSLESLSWVQALFAEAGLSYKHHWFVEDQLPHILDWAGWSPGPTVRIQQYINVDAWLNSFEIDGARRRSVMKMIASAPPGIRKSMQIQKVGSSFKMLRLQNMVCATRVR